MIFSKEEFLEMVRTVDQEMKSKEKQRRMGEDGGK